MKIITPILWSAISAAAITLLGCDLHVSREPRERAVLVQPQPQYAAAQPQYVEAQPQYIVVQQAPPAIIAERRPPAPSGAHIWIDGSWNWDNQRYVWQAGRYEVPPQAGAVWVAARYDPSSHHFTPGQWQTHASGHDKGHNHH